MYLTAAIKHNVDTMVITILSKFQVFIVRAVISALEVFDPKG